MTIDNHYLLLGKLVSNFQSLELALRVFLTHLPTARPCARDIYLQPVGTDLDASELTDHCYLSTLVRRYNDGVVQQGCGERIDAALVDVRNAVMHGRIALADSADPPLRLLQFSAPAGGKVKVLFNQIMDEAWFVTQIKRCGAELLKVKAACQSFAPKS